MCELIMPLMVMLKIKAHYLMCILLAEDNFLTTDMYIIEACLSLRPTLTAVSDVFGIF